MSGKLTEEHVLRHDGLLGQLAQVALAGRRVGHGLLLDARPGQVDVEEEEQHPEAYDGGLEDVSANAVPVLEVPLRIPSASFTYIEAVAIAHQRVVQQVSVDLTAPGQLTSSPAHDAAAGWARGRGENAPEA